MALIDTKAKRWEGRLAERLAYLAAIAAIEVPERQNTHTSRAGVDWDTIHAIRALLTEAGFDWRRAVRLRRQAERENAQAARDERQRREDEARAKR